MKKNILFILISLHAFLSNAQIPTINAQGGESKVNWDYRFKMNKENEDEHPFVYGSGCTESPTKSYASSCLSQQGNSSYFSKNLIDWDPRTAWVEGKSDYGIGEYFEIDLPYGGSNIGIFNGYQKNHDAWMNNSRVKKLKVYGDGKPICFVVLSDKMGVQNFDLPANSDFNKYKFEIVEVYPGTWKGVTGISHTGTPITSDMLFGIVSNTKLFTGVLLLKLAENNMIHLNDSLHQYLPTFNNIDSNITIRQLLNHTTRLERNG